MFFTISKDHKSISKIDSESFVNLNIWERQHIEEWVRKSPEILGEDLLIVSSEFDRFEGSKDRLDLLAIDRMGNLVVIELKRDSFAGYADLQAIRYAAMISAMTIDKLLPYYISYQKGKLGIENVTEEDSRTKIVEFVNKDNFDEITNRPRIILCSEDFSQEITTTVLWLRQFGVDITCVKITPHRMDEKIIIVPSIIIPLKEAKQYLIDIQQKEEEQQEPTSRRTRMMSILIENNLLKAGDKIYLKNALPTYIKYNDQDPIFHAVITGKLGQSNAVKWEKDNQEYAISALTWLIFKDLHPEKKDPGGLSGVWFWVNEEGTTLWDIANNYLENQKK